MSNKIVSNNALLDISAAQPAKSTQAQSASSQGRQKSATPEPTSDRTTEQSRRFDKEYDRAKQRQASSNPADAPKRQEASEAKRPADEKSKEALTEGAPDHSVEQVDHMMGAPVQQLVLSYASAEEMNVDAAQISATQGQGEAEDNAGDDPLEPSLLGAVAVKQNASLHAHGEDAMKVTSTSHQTAVGVPTQQEMGEAGGEGVVDALRKPLKMSADAQMGHSGHERQNAKQQHLTEQMSRTNEAALLASEASESDDPNEPKRFQSVLLDQKNVLTAQQQKSVTLEPVMQSTRINTAFGKPEWGSAVNQRIVWLANQEVSSARIIMDPPELGPIEVQLKLKGDQSQVFFYTHNQGVKEVLESALPKLRTLFEENGLALTDAGVHDHSEGRTGDDEAPGEGDRPRPFDEMGSDDAVHLEEGAMQGLVSETLVDYYI